MLAPLFQACSSALVTPRVCALQPPLWCKWTCSGCRLQLTDDGSFRWANETYTHEVFRWADRGLSRWAAFGPKAACWSPPGVPWDDLSVVIWGLEDADEGPSDTGGGLSWLGPGLKWLGASFAVGALLLLLLLLPREGRIPLLLLVVLFLVLRGLLFRHDVAQLCFVGRCMLGAGLACAGLYKLDKLC